MELLTGPPGIFQINTQLLSACARVQGHTLSMAAPGVTGLQSQPGTGRPWLLDFRPDGLTYKVPLLGCIFPLVTWRRWEKRIWPSH